MSDKLRRIVEREKADIGVLITLRKPTKTMRKEALSSGFYKSLNHQTKYFRIQILTVAELFE